MHVSTTCVQETGCEHKPFFFPWKSHRNAGVIREQQSCIVELWVMAVLVH